MNTKNIQNPQTNDVKPKMVLINNGQTCDLQQQN